MRHLLTAAVCAALATPAAAFTAQNGLVVRADGSDAFDVAWTGPSGAPDFWCAAGDFAIRGLNLPTATRIFRYDAPRRKGGEGIRFGLDESRAQPTGLLRLQGGRGLTAAYARRFCERSR